MKNKLAKVVSSGAALASSLYWAAGSVVAETASLCPKDAKLAGLCNTSNLGVNEIVRFILNTVIFVAFVAALVFLIIGGIKWIMSGGDKEGTSKAKEAVTAALIGLAVVLGSWVLINIVLSLFGIKGGISGLEIPTLVGN